MGWTPTDRDIRTPYGVIHYGGACRDNYPNIVSYDQGGGHTIFSLQRPAMRSWLDAQVRFARMTGWAKRRIENSKARVGGKVYTEGRPIAVLVGTNRTCAVQAALYRSDPGRYADPRYTGHTRGLAVDVNQDQGLLAEIHVALTAMGWHRARPDEPWHYSFHESI